MLITRGADDARRALATADFVHTAFDRQRPDQRDPHLEAVASLHAEVAEWEDLYRP